MRSLFVVLSMLTYAQKLIILWLLCIVGSWSVLPYSYYLGLIPAGISIPTLLAITTLQSAMIFGFVCYMCYKLIPYTDLTPFSNTQTNKRILCLSLFSGFAAGLTIYLIERAIFQNSTLSQMHPPFWAGALASIYGSVNEEVFLRLFVFTFLYFLLGRVFNITARNRLMGLWATNVVVATLFGLGHLPAAFNLAAPSTFEIFRILLLNGIPGIVFGWLYWSYGLMAAIIAHFTADLVIHVFLPI